MYFKFFETATSREDSIGKRGEIENLIWFCTDEGEM